MHLLISGTCSSVVKWLADRFGLTVQMKSIGCAMVALLVVLVGPSITSLAQSPKPIEKPEKEPPNRSESKELPPEKEPSPDSPEQPSPEPPERVETPGQKTTEKPKQEEVSDSVPKPKDPSAEPVTEPQPAPKDADHPTLAPPDEKTEEVVPEAIAEQIPPTQVKTAPIDESQPKRSEVAKPTREETPREFITPTENREEKTTCAKGLPAVDNRPSSGPPIRLKGSVGFLTSSDSSGQSVWVSPLINSWFRIIDTVAVSADWGFAFLNGTDRTEEDRNEFLIGNPFIGIHSVRQHGCTELRVGIGATLPLASLPDNKFILDEVNPEYDFAIKAYRGAMAMRGMWHWWLWVPESMSVAIPISWETAASDEWIGSGEVALASTVILRDGSLTFMPVKDTPTAMLLIPVGGTVGYRIDPVVLGIQLQAIWFANADELQLSTTPLIRLELDTGYLEGRFHLNLDRPFGFGADKYLEGMVWAAHIGGGVGF